MEIKIKNKIKVGDQTEIIEEIHACEVMEKGDYTYLVHNNSEKEKVVIKLNQDELVMTRFSNPKSIMRFYKNEDGGAIIPTPMGIQQFLITTDLFQLEAGHLQVSYRLLTLDGEQEFANYQLLVEWEE